MWGASIRRGPTFNSIKEETEQISEGLQGQHRAGLKGQVYTKGHRG